MIYFSIKEIITSIISFFILGCFCGGAYKSSYILLDFSKKLLALPVYSYRKHNKNLKLDIIIRQRARSELFTNIFDFLFTVLISISFILFSYVFLDGSVRAFSLLFFAFGYILSLNFLSGYITVILIKSTNCLFLFFLFIYCILLYPLFFLIGIIKKIIEPIINSMVNKLEIINTKRIIQKKSKQIEKFFIKNNT